MVAALSALLAVTVLLQAGGWVDLPQGTVSLGGVSVKVSGGEYYVQRVDAPGVAVYILSSLGPVEAEASLHGGTLEVTVAGCGSVAVNLSGGWGAARIGCARGEVVVLAGVGGGGRGLVYSPRDEPRQVSSLDGAARALSLAALALAVVSELAARRGGG